MLTLGRHLSDLVFLTILLIAPLPISSVWSAALDHEDPRRSAALEVLRVAILWCAIQLSVALGLGSAGLLMPTPVLVTESGLLIIGTLLATVRFESVGSWLGRFRGTAPFELVELLLIGTLGAVFAAWLIEIAASPTKNYDALMYHLPMMANWYQTGSLATLDDAFPIQSRYPLDWELLCTLFLMPFREDFLVLLPNLIAWLVFALAVYCTAVDAGARRPLALAAALPGSTLPIIHLHVVTPHTDLPLAAFFAAGVFFSLRAAPTSADTAMAVVSVALVLGVRVTGIVYGGLLVVTMAAARRWPLRARAAGDRTAPALPFWSAIAVAAMVGGFWRVRNAIRSSHSAGIVFSAASPGHGPITAAEVPSILTALDWTSADAWRLFAREIFENLGWQVPLLVIAAVAAACAGGFRGVNAAARTSRALLLLALCTAVLFLLTPWGAVYYRQMPPFDSAVVSLRTRFGYPFFGTLALLGGALAALWRRSTVPVAAAAVAVGLGSVADRVVAIVVLAGGALAAVGAALAHRVRRLDRLGRTAALAAVSVLSLVVVGSSYYLRQRRDLERVKTFGPVFAWLESNVGSDEVVGYALSHRSYLLYGKHLQRRVLYLPGAPVDPGAGTIGANDPLGRRRAFAPPNPGEEDGWLRRLRRAGVTVFAVGPIRPDWSSAPELSWLERSGGAFRRVFGRHPESEVVVYRVEATAPR